MGKHMTETMTSKVVTTAGTAVALSAVDLWVDILEMQAKKVGGDNTGNIFRGDSTLDQGVKEGIELIPGAVWNWEGNRNPEQTINLAAVFIDGDVSGDGVVFSYWQITGD